MVSYFFFFFFSFELLWEFNEWILINPTEWNGGIDPCLLQNSQFLYTSTNGTKLMCEQLFETYRSFASESEKEGISTSLQQTEEWLYEDGDNETEKVYAGKIEELKKVIILNFS